MIYLYEKKIEKSTGNDHTIQIIEKMCGRHCIYLVNYKQWNSHKIYNDG